MSKRRGHWADHEYKRGSVKRDADGFVGWDYLEDNIFRQLRFIPQWRQKLAILSAMVLTGGRINEVLLLRRENFVDFPQEPRLVVIHRMPLFKRYAKIEGFLEQVARLPTKMATGELKKSARRFKELENGTFAVNRWKTEKIEAFRDLSFPRAEPFVEEWLLPWVEKFDEGPLFDISYDSVYHALYRLEVIRHPLYSTPRKNYYPHWVGRAMRACQLRMEYGFGYEDLKDFFMWTSEEVIGHYARLGGVATGMMMLKAVETLEANR